MAKPPDRTQKAGSPRSDRLRSDLVSVALVAGLFGAVNLLPPDTSLRLVEEAGVLRVCVPASYPPLVTGDRAKPGFDLSVLEEIARRMNLRLSLNVSQTMGQDFNPTNWHITRAQCEVIAGGVVTSPTTRSFLDTISTGIENGWVALGKGGAAISDGKPVGVFPGASGLSRTALSAYLRGKGAQIVLAPSAAALAEGLRAGRFDVAITSSLDARSVTAAVPEATVTLLPDSLGRFQFGLGLWKGDLTLKRRLVTVYGQLESEGFLAQQRGQYGLL